MTIDASPVTLVRNVRVFDGTTVRPSSAVLIEQGLIADVGPRITPPAGALVVNGRGRTLLPGLIDCHTHLPRGSSAQAAVFGVTTELDLFAEPTGRRQQWGEAADFVRIADPDEGAARAVDAAGGTVVQVRVTAARSRRTLVLSQATGRGSARQAVAAGVDGLVHLFVDAPADEAFVAAVADAGVFVVPTLTALEALCGTAGGVGVAADPRLVPYLDRESRTGLAQSLPPWEGQSQFDRAVTAAGRLRAAGVSLVTGTDAPNPGTAHGVSLHRELELLVAAGLSPVEALASATSVPARCFGLTDRGRIARGLHADLLLVDGDPTADISATRAVVGVWRRGVRVDREWWRAAVNDPVEVAGRVNSAALR